MAIAVSGGADSLCLALLASRWRKGCHALIVDHGLRPESGEEATTAARCAEGLGLTAHVLRLELPVVDSGLQERARAARYAALREACHRLGILDLLVAHHRDDQIETIAMRENARSGASGLAGIALSTELSDIRVLRPLLEVEPARLRATLENERVPWVEDPSNRNRRFERVRWRQDLQVADRRRLSAFSNLQGATRDERQVGFCDEVLQVRSFPEGYFWLPDGLVAPDLLARLWRVTGHGRGFISSEIMRSLVLAPRDITLAGAMLHRSRRRAGGWFLTREPADVSAPVPAVDGAIWDGRWEWRDPSGWGLGLQIGARQSARPSSRRDLPASVWRTLPAVWRDGEIVDPRGWGPSSGFFLVRPSGATDGSFWKTDPFVMRKQP